MAPTAAASTPLCAQLDVPKSPPREVADRLLDALKAGSEDIFPDETAVAMAETWWSDTKSFELAFANY